MFGISAFAESPFASLAGIGGNVNVSLIGQSATGSVGTTTFVCVAHINPTGQGTTSAVGGVGITAGGDIGVTGLAITSGLGSPALTANAIVSDYGNNPDEPLSALTGAISGVGVNAQAVATLPSLSTSVGSVGVTVTGAANVTPAGQLGTSALGTITQRSSNTIVLSGFGLTSGLGTITSIAKANVTLVGFEMTSELSTVLVWSMLDDSQSSSFSEITESQTSSFSEITDTQDPNWEDVA